ncbi:MAG TPA: hypothetical protein VFI35_13240 [Actinomycetota bacterium]|nr:hypothetical protein [Actinomycetota bacterium]
MTGVTVVGVRGHLVAVEAHVGREIPVLTNRDAEVPRRSLAGPLWWC